MKRKVTLHDIKQALLDNRFRETLPPELEKDIEKFLNNPGCSCNVAIYQKVAKLAAKQLSDYYPSKDVQDPTSVPERLARNQWMVFSCSIHELEEKLKKLSPGRKQLEIARWQDQVTVVVNELEEVW